MIVSFETVVTFSSDEERTRVFIEFSEEVVGFKRILIENQPNIIAIYLIGLLNRKLNFCSINCLVFGMQISQ